MAAKAPIAIIIPTRDEQVNLPFALSSVKDWAQQVFVIDSGSTDDTEKVAVDNGATFVYHPWEGYARQKNWALDNLPITAKWVFFLDADERITPELRDELISIANLDSCLPNGFYVNRHLIFLGRRIRHCGYYPAWNVRFFRRGKARYEEREVHEHMIVSGAAGYLRGEMEHNDRRGFEHFIAKHNHYSTLEAREIFRMQHRMHEGRMQFSFWGGPIQRRRWVKHHIWHKLPVRWLARWFYMYFVQLGILDGRAGLHLSLFVAEYEHQITLKLVELKKVGMSPSVQGLPAVARMGLPPALPLPLAVPGLIEAAPQVPNTRLSQSDAEIVSPAQPFSLSDESEPARSNSAGRTNISVLILTYNEEINLPACLASVAWADDIIVLDSFSTDRTVEIANAAGARVFQRRFDNERNQRTASLQLPFKHEWVYNPDADEVTPAALRDELMRVVVNTARREVAYRVRFRLMFMGKWIKRSSLYPTWVVRLFKPDKISFERDINLRYIINGPEGRLNEHFDHHSFRKGVTAWYEKHNGYSDLEAREAMKVLGRNRAGLGALLQGGPLRRRAALKDLSFRLPFRGALIYLYMMFIRGGILDGPAGWTFCHLRSSYESMIEIKIKELKKIQDGLTI